MVKEWNLTDMIVDGKLGTGRLLTRDELTADQIERFESKVDRSAGDDACHLWQAGRDPLGYGHFRVGKRRVSAHRITYALAFGFIPAGLVVRHRCDNPPCCNPAHLRIGTDADNNRDKAERGRCRPVTGEGNGMAKLTVEAVNDMRRRARAGASYVDLGAEYGVSDFAVWQAVTGRSWLSASEPPVVEVRCQKRPWSPEEDEVILATLDDPRDEVAERLDRSVTSVVSRRYDLTHGRVVLRTRQEVSQHD